MKSISRLKYQPDCDSIILGISYSGEISRLSWILNKSLKLNLSQTCNLVISKQKLHVMQEFTVYIDENLNGNPLYRLVSNKSGSGYLCSSYKHFDYFFQIFKSENTSIRNLISKIKSIEDILLVNHISNPNNTLMQILIL